jgi:hypothetical protein
MTIDPLNEEQHHRDEQRWQLKESAGNRFPRNNSQINDGMRKNRSAKQTKTEHVETDFY